MGKRQGTNVNNEPSTSKQAKKSEQSDPQSEGTNDGEDPPCNDVNEQTNVDADLFEVSI